MKLFNIELENIRYESSIFNIPKLSFDVTAEVLDPRCLFDYEYNVRNEILNALFNRQTVKRVIFNNPATIIFWDDGTKTVVKCQNGEPFDEEKGFVMAYLKKLLGNDNTFNKEIKKYCIKDYLPDYIKEYEEND